MGLSLFGSINSSCSCKSSISTKYAPSQYTAPTRKKLAKRKRKLPNPNPSNYEILEVKEIGKWCVAKIKYPDCANYEGIKILVFKNASEKEIRAAKFIDPHFCENGDHLNVIARFKPTCFGMELAITYCEYLESCFKTEK